MKIAHVVNYAPYLSGMYGTVKDLMLEERTRGHTAEVIDDVGGYEILKERRDEIVPVPPSFGYEADVICWHHAMYEDWFNEPHRNLVLFLHGTPEFNFFTEMYSKDQVLSLIIGLSNMKIPRRIVSMWKRHIPIWEGLLDMPVEYVPVWTRLDQWSKSPHKVEKDTINIAMIDFWRYTREPFSLFAALDYLRRNTDKKIKVHAWGLTEIPNKTYLAVIQNLLNDGILEVMGNTSDPMTDIYHKNDMVLSMSTEETRVVREAFACGVPVVCGRAGLEYTEFCADSINPAPLAAEIERCHEVLLTDTEKVRTNLRAFAESNFDVKDSADAVIKIFEEVVAEHGSPDSPKLITSNGVRMVASIDDTTNKIEEKMKSGKPFTYVRFGDGDLLLMKGAEGESFHKNSPELQEELKEAFQIKDPDYIVGSVAGMINEKKMRKGLFARFGYDDELQEVVNELRPGETLDNAVALLYKSVFEASWFVPFLREQFHSKSVLFVGNEATWNNELVKSVLNISRIVPLPAKDAYYHLDRIMEDIEAQAKEHEIIVCAAGMATRVIAKRLWKKGIRKTFIDIGSIVDALLGEGTRSWIRLIGENFRDTYASEFLGSKTDIIVLTHKQEEATKQCFESIAKHTTNYRVIWVDNGSGDESVNDVITVGSQLEECDMIRIPENVGFSKAANLGLKKFLTDSTATHVVLLNNDVILTPQWLNRMKLSMSAASLDAVGPLTSEGNPHFVENFRAVSPNLPKFDQETQDERALMLWEVNRQAVMEVNNMLSFFCCLMTREAVEQTGLLDENLFAYGEDNDYCTRLRACGRKLGIALGTYVHHDHHVTSLLFGQEWIDKKQEEAKEYLAKKYNTQLASVG